MIQVNSLSDPVDTIPDPVNSFSGQVNYIPNTVNSLADLVNTILVLVNSLPDPVNYIPHAVNSILDPKHWFIVCRVQAGVLLVFTVLLVCLFTSAASVHLITPSGSKAVSESRMLQGDSHS